MPFRDLISAHAWREAHRERITLEMIEEAYVYPDFARASHHDVGREIRCLYLDSEVLEVVVDTIDGRVVTVWRRRLDQ